MDWSFIRENQNIHRRIFYSKVGLWNDKYYESIADFDGRQVQRIANLDKEEPPYARDFFHKSNGRFALKNKAVAYWAGNIGTAKMEATPELKVNNGVTLD